MGNIVKSYKELEIWKNGMNIVEIIYEIVSHFPENEKYVLSNQILRASVSIPSNIAEGFGRYSKKYFARFIGIAIGSLFKLETQLSYSKKSLLYWHRNFSRNHGIDWKRIKNVIFFQAENAWNDQ